jgi:hypothetical protein
MRPRANALRTSLASQAQRLGTQKRRGSERGARRTLQSAAMHGWWASSYLRRRHGHLVGDLSPRNYCLNSDRPTVSFVDHIGPKTPRLAQVLDPAASDMTQSPTTKAHHDWTSNNLETFLQHLNDTPTEECIYLRVYPVPNELVCPRKRLEFALGWFHDCLHALKPMKCVSSWHCEFYAAFVAHTEEYFLFQYPCTTVQWLEDNNVMESIRDSGVDLSRDQTAGDALTVVGFCVQQAVKELRKKQA